MSEVPQDAWFFSKDGKQYGPVAMEELKFVASNGQLHPRQDLVWRAGMESWLPSGEIEGLFEKVVPTEVEVPAMAATPDLSTDVEEDNARELMALQKNWVGVGRAGYFIGTIVLSAVGTYAPGLIRPQIASLIEGHENVMMAVPVLVVIGNIVLGVKRLRNVGMSGWWFLGHLVPFLNLWVGYRAFACPGGYNFHRKMDGAGIFLAIIYWLLVLASLVAAVAVIMIAAGLLGSPEVHDKLQEIQQEILRGAQGASARVK
ncbi:GYF domain-containing protein [Luteolibacter sp. LG18]|uniref:GYF domain-containing protein n=1 Tax=Luteolibacter sp. LG18 TaxID=2819286 RepID=UPI002B2E27CF|nr:hypothetical protein llg_20100 [Luteolibacter sp. LG18]